jgi:hypothetical protein
MPIGYQYHRQNYGAAHSIDYVIAQIVPPASRPGAWPHARIDVARCSKAPASVISASLRIVSLVPICVDLPSCLCMRHQECREMTNNLGKRIDVRFNAFSK